MLQGSTFNEVKMAPTFPNSNTSKSGLWLSQNVLNGMASVYTEGKIRLMAMMRNEMAVELLFYNGGEVGLSAVYGVLTFIGKTGYWTM